MVKYSWDRTISAAKLNKSFSTRSQADRQQERDRHREGTLFYVLSHWVSLIMLMHSHKTMRTPHGLFLSEHQDGWNRIRDADGQTGHRVIVFLCNGWWWVIRNTSHKTPSTVILGKLINTSNKKLKLYCHQCLKRLFIKIVLFKTWVYNNKRSSPYFLSKLLGTKKDKKLFFPCNAL